MSPLFIAFFVAICMCAQGFFSMFEMAAVSFNKIRLEYYVGQKNTRAIWLSSLLKKPSRLFGTTLILVNTFLQCGSELSRIFYESIGLDPAFAPITQIFLVLIFAELAPMFAARRHPEHVAFLYIPVVMLFSKILSPLIWVIDRLNAFLQWSSKTKDQASFLSREELQRAFEEGQESSFVQVMEKFFTMRKLTAESVMLPFSSYHQISSQGSLKDLRRMLQAHYSPFVVVYHQQTTNIVGIAYLRDMLGAKDEDKVIDYAKSPWFITESDFVLEILSQFRLNNQTAAIVLGPSGKPLGLVTLTLLTDEIFGRSSTIFLEAISDHKSIYFERTVQGDLLMEEFVKTFHVPMEYDLSRSLSDYIIDQLGHHPVEGEVLHLEYLDIQVLETTLFAVKKASIKTR